MRSVPELSGTRENAISRLQASSAPEARGFGLIFVADLEGELLGVLDPTHDELFRWKKANESLHLVGFGHRAREILRLAVAQLAHCIDTDLLQQPDIALTHA